MRRTSIISALGWLLMATCSAAPAQVSSFVETPLFAQATRKPGSQFRGNLKQAVDKLEAGDARAAEALLAPIRRFCDAQQRPGQRVVSVANPREYAQAVAARKGGQAAAWIDITCPAAYSLTGYAHAGAKRYDEALRWLDRASAIAPYFADSRNERAYVLGQTGKLREALAGYKAVIALADAQPSARYIKPVALRGTGYVLVELGDLAGARQAYEASLTLDPGSRVAKDELDYIAKQQGKKATR
jgi:tetratricopeptide (TPR) repeat protein